MSELQFDAVSQSELSQLSVTFHAGSHVVLGSERDGTSTLLLVAAGLLRPTLGRVTLGGRAVWPSASVRRQIATLCAHEVLLPANDTLGALELALAARGETRPALGVLEAAGLSSLARRRPSELTTREVRAAALALALSHPKPALVLLHEPLGLLEPGYDDFLLQSLQNFTERGVIVLCTASRTEDAVRLGGTVSALDRGRFLDPSQINLASPPISLRVRTPEPRRLAARLSEAPDIFAVEWSGGQELVVRGNDLERVAHSVVANARAEAIRIVALRQDFPTLEVLAATRAGLSQAAYERARGLSWTRPL